MPNLDDVSRFISTVGFPIAISVAVIFILGWLGNKLVKSVTAHIDANTESLPKILGAIEEVGKGMNSICKANCDYMELRDEARAIERR